MDLPPGLLQRPPEEAARRIALGFLAEARAAAACLDDPGDGEALHDFRVAVRRLRSTLRAWRPWLGKSVKKKTRRALRALQNATGGGRDAEVALAWLATQRPELTPAQRRGCDWLVARLERRRREAMAHVRDDLRREFAALEGDLQARLEVMTLELHLDRPYEGPVFGEVLAERAREQARRLSRSLARVRSVEDRAQCHRTRIEGKRLRYLVEPVRSMDGAKTIVKHCKRLQDVLGDLNDAHVLVEEIGEALQDAAAERARRLHELARTDAEGGAHLRREVRRSERPGLLELTRRVELRIRELFARVERDWAETGIHALLEDVDHLAEELLRAGRPEVPLVRTWLLEGPPDLADLDAAGALQEPVEIEEGWLPGDRVRERVRRVRRGGAAEHSRILEVEDPRRRELHEPTPRFVFESLWPLTDGCRIRVTRHAVRDGGREWWLDEFRDRELWLARLALPSDAAPPPLPPWLQAAAVREVTDDPRYAPRKLAGTFLTFNFLGNDSRVLPES